MFDRDAAEDALGMQRFQQREELAEIADGRLSYATHAVIARSRFGGAASTSRSIQVALKWECRLPVAKLLRQRACRQFHDASAGRRCRGMVATRPGTAAAAA
jgi:hypothetical protein